MFRLDGDVRTIAFAGRAVALRDLKGMRYLARLLAAPDREFHVLDLVGGEIGEVARSGADLGPVLDGQARAAYKRRLAEIDEDMDEATAVGDDVRLGLARADRDYLIRELAGAFGLGGRNRIAGSPSERTRASVTRSLRYALSRIAEHHPAMADHLERTVLHRDLLLLRPGPADVDLLGTLTTWPPVTGRPASQAGAVGRAGRAACSFLDAQRWRSRREQARDRRPEPGALRWLVSRLPLCRCRAVLSAGTCHSDGSSAGGGLVRGQRLISISPHATGSEAT
ncbi:hypothetical protein [Blastococcus saxobsidens]|uniref:Uncharacterized protein n=1 Tax=Blastococcus saxobsidens (strain DD2) TaxID=1146883 RepID=H6RIQ6_BLASD|nr:hypothetical protein [Blastococcus saxobsidens]CCG02250.1 protein of unknown function; putative coiled-coil domain [Blastococcus saxobsidens DD2]